MVTAAGTFFPCCVSDACCADQVTNSSHSGKKQQEGACSPFFACATCPGFTEISKPILLVLPVFETQVHHEINIVPDLSAYASTFWQPPRSC